MTDADLDLGTRRFTLDDQLAFGAASHDLNPMHIDPVAARRLLTGAAVVHGVHTLLTALECLPEDAGPAGPMAIDCRFLQPVNVGETVAFTRVTGADGVVTLDAAVDGVNCMRARLQPATAPASPPPAPAGDAVVLAPAPVPDERPAADHVGRSYLLPGWGPALEARFPRVAARFGAGVAGALGALSYVVGMVCPGLHSVFSSLNLSTAGTNATAPLHVRVLRHEPRFGMVTIAFDGPLHGELTAFERARPQPQPTAEELATRMPATRFAGRQAWVLGGSRGLGELTAKLLGAGGADVTLTYAQGHDDAEAVAREIDVLGRGRARAAACDLRVPDSLAALLAGGAPDAVFYFATPRIARKAAGVFDRAAFDDFADFYLDRFAALCTALETSATRPVVVYLPSTVFIEERPKGLAAYAMAKAAAEILAAELNRTLRRVRVVHTRLPRLATDQTAGVRGLDRWANTEAMLGVLNAVFGEGPAA